MTYNIATDCQNGCYPELKEIKIRSDDITQTIKLPGQKVPEGQTPEQCFHSLRDLFKNTKVDYQIVSHAVPFFRGDDDYEEDDHYMDLEDDLDGDIDEYLSPEARHARMIDEVMLRGMEVYFATHRMGPGSNDWVTEDESDLEVHDSL